MRALRWRGRGDVALETVAVPQPGDDEALIRVQWVGVCGSDLEEYRDGPIVVTGPVTLGHEIVGTVAVPARDGSGPAAGTTVVVDVVTGCGHCFWCRRQEEGLCPDLRVTGLHVDGGLADYVLGRAARLVPVPAGLDPKLAVLAEPTAVAVRAVRKLGDVGGLGVLVIGGGSIGLLVAQVLRVAGAGSVVVVEPSRRRREVAQDLGLTALWDDSAEARAAQAARHFPAHGIDAVVECSGATGAAGEAVRRARPGGTAVLLSVTPADQPIDVTGLVLGEKVVLGSAAHRWDLDVAPAVELLAVGAVRAEPLITHTVSLDRGTEAFALLAGAGGDTIKVVVDVRDRAQEQR